MVPYSSVIFSFIHSGRDLYISSCVSAFTNHFIFFCTKEHVVVVLSVT